MDLYAQPQMQPRIHFEGKKFGVRALAFLIDSLILFAFYFIL
jgi:uncharacterized RDD family membrane protein YckC